MSLSTENLYLGAYALTRGASLKRVFVSRSNGRSTAVFELEGEAVETLAAEYHSEQAVVNLAAFRQSLELLKDELFAALRQNERRGRSHEEENRYRGRP